MAEKVGNRMSLTLIDDLLPAVPCLFAAARSEGGTARYKTAVFRIEGSTAWASIVLQEHRQESEGEA